MSEVASETNATPNPTLENLKEHRHYYNEALKVIANAEIMGANAIIVGKVLTFFHGVKTELDKEIAKIEPPKPKPELKAVDGGDQGSDESGESNEPPKVI